MFWSYLHEKYKFIYCCKLMFTFYWVCKCFDSIKPSDVKAYITPNNLILAKSLNGKDGNGKEYLFQPRSCTGCFNSACLYE